MTDINIPKDTNIFFQNGMFNNFNSAIDSANLISGDTNRHVGLLVNNTGNQYSRPDNDVWEYMPRSKGVRPFV